MATGVIEGLREGFQPPPEYTVSQWADQYVHLPEEAAEPGRWRTDRAPYQREMMDVLTDPDVSVVCYHTSAQVGKTAIELNGIGYHIHHAPAAMLRLDPSEPMSEAFVQDKLDPMLRATPVLSERVAPEGGRSAVNNVGKKEFPGGYLSMAWATSSTALRMRSVKLVWADEIDEYPLSINKQGDPIALAYKRTQTFRAQGAKLVLASTPVLKGMSRIDEYFEASDKRYFFVPCEQCGTFDHLVWEQLKWEKGKPETAYYECPHCGFPMSDSSIKRQVKFGHWRATAPFNGTAGFHIWQIYSPWSSLREIAREHDEAKGKAEKEQYFWNTVVGRSYDGDLTAGVEAEELLARREQYNATSLPQGLVMLTAGVDVQGDRLEMQVVGHGPNDELWVVAYYVIPGDPTTSGPWDLLEEQLFRTYRAFNGQQLGIEAAAIDSGYSTQQVYDFAAKHFRLGRRWYAIKGVDGPGRIAWARSKIKIRGGARLFLVGVDGLKEEVYKRIGAEPDAENPTPRLHIPLSDEFDLAWMQSLTAERVRVIYNGRGFPTREWYKPPGERNEALDTLVYAVAAAKSLNLDLEARLAAMTKPQQREDVAAVAALFK